MALRSLDLAQVGAVMCRHAHAQAATLPLAVHALARGICLACERY